MDKLTYEELEEQNLRLIEILDLVNTLHGHSSPHHLATMLEAAKSRTYYFNSLLCRYEKESQKANEQLAKGYRGEIDKLKETIKNLT